MPNQHWKEPGMYVLQGQRMPGKARTLQDIIWQLQQLGDIAECNHIESYTHIRKIQVKQNIQEVIDNRILIPICHTDNFVTPLSLQIGLQAKPRGHSLDQLFGQKPKILYSLSRPSYKRLISKHSTKRQKNNRWL